MEKSNRESERRDVYITTEPVVVGAGVQGQEPKEEEEDK